MHHGTAMPTKPALFPGETTSSPQKQTMSPHGPYTLYNGGTREDGVEGVTDALHPLSRCWPRSIPAFFLSLGVVIYFLFPVCYPWYPRTRLPPLYPEFHQRDLQLPQHELNLTAPEGCGERYIWIANQVRGVGWGNFMEEFVLDAFLAYQAGWTNVFSNYTWRQDGPEYSLFEWRKIVPSRIPLSALISGPLVGDPWPGDDQTPRSVVKEYWDKICPTRVVIDPRDVDRDFPKDAPLTALFERWTQTLNSLNTTCVEIDRRAGELFGSFHGSASRLLDIWPSYSKSPILSHFRWSTLIESAVQSNAHLFIPAPSNFTVYPYEPIPGLLAIHVRRGDYSRHCGRLARARITFMALNSFPQFSDKLIVPPRANEDQVTRIYMQSCFPTIDEIVAKVVEIRRHQEFTGGERLKYLYIMTNGERSWVKNLREALRYSGDWESITSSRDLRLNWEQKFVGQAVDMLIGQRAQVLIGNGFSTLTSNTVMLRMARGIPYDSNRFW